MVAGIIVASFIDTRAGYAGAILVFGFGFAAAIGRLWGRTQKPARF
jgi:hypothetical protein